MLTWLPPGSALRALAAGGLYAVLYIAGVQATTWVIRRTGDWTGAVTLRLRRWRGWPRLGQAAALVWSVGFPFALALDGTFAADAIGLRTPDWGLAVPWTLAITAGGVLWLALLWRRYAPGDEATVPNDTSEAQPVVSGVLGMTLISEAQLATWRGAFIPLAGRYGGIWLAVAARFLMMWTSPLVRARLERPTARGAVFLDWGLDWVSAVLYLFTGSVWLALAGRTACWAIVQGASARREARHGLREALLPDDQRQDNQQGEHGRREDPQAL